jgi:hypothetical protein
MMLSVAGAMAATKTVSSSWSWGGGALVGLMLLHALGDHLVEFDLHSQKFPWKLGWQLPKFMKLVQLNGLSYKSGHVRLLNLQATSCSPQCDIASRWAEPTRCSWSALSPVEPRVVAENVRLR